MAITFDATATILRLAAATVPDNYALDGIDLLPYASGQKPADSNRTLYWRLQDTDCRRWTSTTRAKAVREGPWKVHLDVWRGKEYLYNLGDDIGEASNLVRQRPEIAARLKRKLEAWEKAVTPDNARFAKGPAKLANMTGTIAAVARDSVTIRSDHDAEETRFRIAASSSLKSVVHRKVSDIADGTLVKVDGRIAPDRASIVAKRISVNVWRTKATPRGIGKGFVEGVLSRSGAKLLLTFGQQVMEVKLGPRTMVIELDKITVDDLMIGAKVFVNFTAGASEKTLIGLFTYPKR